MSSKTDKMISKKLHEMMSNGSHFTEKFSELRSTRPADRISLYALFAFSIVLGLFMMAAVAIAEMGKVWFFGSLGASILAWGLFYQKIVKTRRLYKMIDTYREALIDKNLRSIKEVANLVDSNLKELVDELKELQDIGLFQQFSIDRTKMLLIEDGDWGLEGSGEYEKKHFSCISCGAQNEIYIRKGSNSFKCEYCETINT